MSAYNNESSKYLLRVFPLLLCMTLPVTATAQAQQVTTLTSRLLQTNNCAQCDLRGTDLSHQNLTGANLQGANLAGANLTNTNLRGANLGNAILTQVVFSNTKLAGANLRNADLSDLDIDVAFEWMEIIGTHLEGARFKYGVTCGPLPLKGGWGCQHL